MDSGTEKGYWWVSWCNLNNILSSVNSNSPKSIFGFDKCTRVISDINGMRNWI